MRTEGLEIKSDKWKLRTCRSAARGVLGGLSECSAGPAAPSLCLVLADDGQQQGWADGTGGHRGRGAELCFPAHLKLLRSAEPGNAEVTFPGAARVREISAAREIPACWKVVQLQPQNRAPLFTLLAPLFSHMQWGQEGLQPPVGTPRSPRSSCLRATAELNLLPAVSCMPRLSCGRQSIKQLCRCKGKSVCLAAPGFQSQGTMTQLRSNGCGAASFIPTFLSTCHHCTTVSAALSAAIEKMKLKGNSHKKEWCGSSLVLRAPS